LVNLYFQIYCPDVNYRVTVGPKLFSIKEIMVGQKLRRVEAFGKAIGGHKNGQKFEIQKSHIHLDIELSDFDDIMKVILSGSKSEFVEKAKPMFNKLKNLMFNRLYTE